MKRRVFISHLINNNCTLFREGAKHSVFFNPENGHLSAIPRHRELEIHLVRKICHQLDVSVPKDKA
jgi:mRNA interferase HicA